MEETDNIAECDFIMSSLGLDICSGCKLRFNCMVIISVRARSLTPTWFRVMVLNTTTRLHTNHVRPTGGYDTDIPCIKKNEGDARPHIDTHRMLSILGCHGDGYVKVSEWKYQQP